MANKILELKNRFVLELGCITDFFRTDNFFKRVWRSNTFLIDSQISLVALTSRTFSSSHWIKRVQ